MRTRTAATYAIALSLAVSVSGTAAAQSTNVQATSRPRFVRPEQLPASARPTPALDAFRQLCTSAVDRRLTMLGTLDGWVDAAKRLSASDRSALKDQIASERSGLQTLRDKIQTDQDAQTLRADCQSIVLDYRVYLLLIPKVHLVVAADRLLDVSSLFEDAASKLQAKVDAAKAQGKDVSGAQSALDDMKSKVAAATSAVSGVPGQVIPLGPRDYPGNRGALQSGYQSLKRAREDLRVARRDAQTVVNDLRAL